MHVWPLPGFLAVPLPHVQAPCLLRLFPCLRSYQRCRYLATPCSNLSLSQPTPQYMRATRILSKALIRKDNRCLTGCGQHGAAPAKSKFPGAVRPRGNEGKRSGKKPASTRYSAKGDERTLNYPCLHRLLSSLAITANHMTTNFILFDIFTCFVVLRMICSQRTSSFRMTPLSPAPFDQRRL